jgi:hypothetical protein
MSTTASPATDAQRRREQAARAARVRWDRARAAELEGRIRALVDAAPPLTDDRRVRLIRILALPVTVTDDVGQR